MQNHSGKRLSGILTMNVTGEMSNVNTAQVT